MRVDLVPVSEAARRLGVNRYRIHQRIAAGSLRAKKVGSLWLVDAGDLRPGRRSRPMSSRMARALAELYDGGAPDVSGSESARLRVKVEALREGPQEDLPAKVSAWLADRAERVEAAVHPQDVAQLRADPRLAPSGVSDPRARLSSSAEVEAYVGRDDLGGLAADYFLDLDQRPDAPNVVLHVVESPVSVPPRLFSAADLFDRRGAREVRAGIELLRRP
jgi:excisionase family DNA binding protein